MTVYVDEARWPFRGQLYCHVWADSLDELHAAVTRVGMSRAWFQRPPKASWPHYDAGPKFRAMLVHNGAVQTDRYGAAEHKAKLTRNKKLLAQIARLRAERQASAA